ncbi:Sensor histidine kinase RcsC [subsurface metagenome]
MASVKPTLTLLAESRGLRFIEATDVKGEIGRVQRSFPEITSIYVADMEGKQIARTGTEELENVSKIWSFQVAKGGDELVSDIYLKPATSEPMQTITLPIIDNGAVVGVLSADISFQRVMRSIMDIDVGGNGNVIVVADNGRVVAHTHMEQVPELDIVRLPAVEAVLAGQEGTMEGYTDELGRQVLGSYTPIEELGWGVLIQRPLADIDAEVGQLRTTIIWVTIAAVLLAVLAGWLMARQIAKPVAQLASASERVAQGDLSTSVDVKSSNEIGVLANSFNQMIVSLKKSRGELQQWGEELERKVEERTADLEQRGQELADTNVRLEEASQHKSQFLANMSHELRTPLNSIIGYTKLMLDGLEGDINEEQKQDLQTVYNNSKHLLELINGLLDLSRIEAGKTVLSYGTFPISDLLSEVIPGMEQLAREKGLALTYSVTPDIDNLYADKAKTKQVLINILGNAVKFTNEGSVKLDVAETNSDFIFSVTDTGIGIKEEDLKAIFDSFQQVGPAQIAGYEGTGLGLAISKQFIDMQGGKIWAESELGKGSTFTFTLPKKKVTSP